MSVLIRDMKMPRDCLECPFIVYRSVYNKNPECQRQECRVGFQTYCDKADCPLEDGDPYIYLEACYRAAQRTLAKNICVDVDQIDAAAPLKRERDE